MPAGDADYAGRWRTLKNRFTQALRIQGVPLHTDAHGNYHLGQRRHWEHTIRDKAIHQVCHLPAEAEMNNDGSPVFGW